MDAHIADLFRRSRPQHRRAAGKLAKKGLVGMDKRLTPEQMSAIQASESAFHASRQAGEVSAPVARASMIDADWSRLPRPRRSVTLPRPSLPARRKRSAVPPRVFRARRLHRPLRPHRRRRPLVAVPAPRPALSPLAAASAQAPPR